MDARTVLALWADDLDLDLTHGNAAELFDLFKKHGYRIIHDSENHGPTLERAADFCWSKRDLLADAEKKQIEAGLTGRDYYGRRLEAELLSRAIRAMGEKK